MSGLVPLLSGLDFRRALQAPSSCPNSFRASTWGRRLGVPVHASMPQRVDARNKSRHDERRKAPRRPRRAQRRDGKRRQGRPALAELSRQSVFRLIQASFPNRRPPAFSKRAIGPENLHRARRTKLVPRNCPLSDPLLRMLSPYKRRARRAVMLAFKNREMENLSTINLRNPRTPTNCTM